MECINKISDCSGCITSVKYSPDASMLAVSSADMSIRLYDTGSWSSLACIDARESMPNTVAFSPDGSALAYCCTTSVVIIDVARMEVRANIKHKQGVRLIGLEYSPDGNMIASAYFTKALVWSAHDGKLMHMLVGHEDLVNAIAFSPDGRAVATASNDGTVIIWDTSTWKEYITLTCNDSVQSLAFSSDSNLLVTGSCYDVAIWDTHSGRCISLFDGQPGWNMAVDISPDSKLVAACGNGNAVDVYSIEQESVVDNLTGHTDWVTSLAFSSDSKRLASGSVDTTVRVWAVQ